MAPRPWIAASLGSWPRQLLHKFVSLIEGKQSFAWTMGRRTALRRFFALQVLVSSSLLVLELVVLGLRWAILGPRLGGCAAALALLLIAQRKRLPPRPVHFASLLLLFVIALIANAVWSSLALAHRTNELHELSLLQLSAYALLVPTFSVRSVAMTTCALSVFEPLVLLVSSAEATIDLLARELVKAVAINAIGLVVAKASEKQHEANQQLVLQFASESKRHVVAQRDTQRLLMATLPEPVVREIAMKGGRAKCAHRYDGVTVLQADLVGFTKLSAEMEPQELLTLLAAIFHDFDEATERLGVHKLKTIGDAYIICCGAFGEGGAEAANRRASSLPRRSFTGELPNADGAQAYQMRRRREETARRCVRMALLMLEIVRSRCETHGLTLNLRIGVHTGKVVGGVIGTVRFHYDMWGPGVLGASHMESTGQSGKIHISDTTAKLLGAAFELDEAMSADEVDSHIDVRHGIKATYTVVRSVEKAPTDATPASSTTPETGSERVEAGSERVEAEAEVGFKPDAAEDEPPAESFHGNEQPSSFNNTSSSFVGGGAIARDGERFWRVSRAIINPIADTITYAGRTTTDKITGTITSTFDHTSQALSNFKGFLGDLTHSESDASSAENGEAAQPNGNVLIVKGGALIAGSKSLARHLHRQTVGVAGEALERTLGVATDLAKGVPLERTIALARRLPKHSLAAARSLPRHSLAAAESLATGTLATGEQLAKGTMSLATGTLATGEQLAKGTMRLSRVGLVKSRMMKSPSAKWRSDASDLLTESIGGRGAGVNASRRAELEAEAAELARHVEEAHGHIGRLCSMLVGLAAYLVAYDMVCQYHALSVDETFYEAHPHHRREELLRSLIIRLACLLAPATFLLLYVRHYTPWTRNRTMATAVLFAAIPGAAAAGIIASVHAEVQPCSAISDMPPPHCSAANATGFVCQLGDQVSRSGEALCEQVPLAFVTTLLLLHAFLPYTFTYAIDLPVLVTLATAGTAAGVLSFIWTETLQSDTRPFRTLGASQWVRLTLMIGWAHALGIAHHFARRTDVLEASALRLRQQRQLREIDEEKERSERLLANIVPPHLIGELKLRLLDGHAAKGGGAQGTDEDAEAHRRAKSRTRWKEALQKLKRTKKDDPRRNSKQLTVGTTGVLVAESYADVSILFAKLEGLDILVNNDSRAPVEVVTLLQRVFDKFDALADIYGVQKVRKTANEQCIFAAGLPDASLLPTPVARACGLVAFGFALLAVMEKLNLELRMWGVPLRLQVGIHSGAVIAGVIGHKTVQWDLCGDAVNTAARMCSYSRPGHLHVSGATHELIRSTYAAVNRGERAIKGKGTMRTYFLVNMPPEALEEMMAEGAAADREDATAWQTPLERRPGGWMLPWSGMGSTHADYV